MPPIPTTLQKHLLSPILYLQGRHVRHTTPILPEPKGQRSGKTGTGPSLNLLLLGDSSAAGVGAPTMESALLGQLLKNLSKTNTVTYRLIAKTGATTHRTLSKLTNTPKEPFDIAITSLGANDSTALVEPSAFLTDQLALINLLETKFQVKHTIISPIPPMHLFPALPQPLRWFIGRQARHLDTALSQALTNHPRATHLGNHGTMDPSMMASDGFHPGPEIYRLWAEVLTGEIRRLEERQYTK